MRLQIAAFIVISVLVIGYVLCKNGIRIFMWHCEKRGKCNCRLFDHGDEAKQRKEPK
jgi:hypothetical protein